MSLLIPREGLRRHPFVKRSGTKDTAESPTQPFWEGHAQINKRKCKKVFQVK